MRLKADGTIDRRSLSRVYTAEQLAELQRVRHEKAVTWDQWIREEHLTLEQIAKRVGLTRERVRQVLRREGFTERSWGRLEGQVGTGRLIRPCAQCGDPYRTPVEATPEQEAYLDRMGFGDLPHLREHADQAGHLVGPGGYYHISKGIAEDYASGMPIRDLLVKYGIRPQDGPAIYRHLDRWGVARNRRPTTIRRPIGRDPIKQREIAEFYRTHSTAETVAKYDISSARVGQIGKKFGVRKKNMGWPRSGTPERLALEARKRELRARRSTTD